MSLKGAMKHWVEAEAKKIVARNHPTKKADAEAKSGVNLKKADTDGMYQAYLAGASYREVGEAFGASAMVVWRRFKWAGLLGRPRGRRAAPVVAK